MSMTDIIDRRRCKRMKGGFKVRIITDENFKLEKDVGESIDISAGGILLKHDKPIEVNRVVNIRFLRPNSFEFFEGNATVVRCELNPDGKTYNIGIEFNGLSDDEMDKFEHFLTSSCDLGNKKIKVIIESTWDIVLKINDRIDEILPEAEGNFIDSLRMISTELVENAVKYGEPVSNLSGIEFELVVDSNKVLIRVDNGVHSEENIKQFMNSIDKISNSKDRFKLYADRLKELMKTSNMNESQLGLFRIAYEGNCDLDYSYEDNILSVIAAMEI